MSGLGEQGLDVAGGDVLAWVGVAVPSRRRHRLDPPAETGCPTPRRVPVQTRLRHRRPCRAPPGRPGRAARDRGHGDRGSGLTHPRLAHVRARTLALAGDLDAVIAHIDNILTAGTGSTDPAWGDLLAYRIALAARQVAAARVPTGPRPHRPANRPERRRFTLPTPTAPTGTANDSDAAPGTPDPTHKPRAWAAGTGDGTPRCKSPRQPARRPHRPPLTR